MTTESYAGVAPCGCPNPDLTHYIGWHLRANHPAVRMLPGIVGWNLRRPTVEECEMVSRDTSYSVPGTALLDDGDTVIETDQDPEAQAHLAAACEAFGMCDAAHVIPAGVYLEE